MDGNSQRNSEVLCGSRSYTQHGLEQRPCAECRILDCRSMHGPVTQDCPIIGCYVCADLASTDIEISDTYKRLCDLVNKRQKIIAKPHHNTIIHRIPVEILSLIFVLVKDEIINCTARELPPQISFHREPPSEQPSQSPPLLVGAVCKRWRDITLAMPELWTDITINLLKSVGGQFTMVKEWASRSGAFPINITIYTRRCEWDNKILGQCGDLLSLLRSLSPRWHNISLTAPTSFFYQLLNNLQRTPLINAISLTLTLGDLEPIQMEHPFLPRHLVFDTFGNSGMIHIPFEWDRLVSFETNETDVGDSFYVIRHAQNLRHCISHPDFERPDSLIPTSPITNHSLVYIDTNTDIIKHLTLPSLRYLNIATSGDVVEDLDTLVRFVNRSSPTLEDFILYLSLNHSDAFPRLDNLRGVTSLVLIVRGLDPSDSYIPSIIDGCLLALTLPSPDPILPRLKRLSLTLTYMCASWWSLFSRLFQQNTPSNSTPDIEAISDTSIPFRRSLSQGYVCVRDLEMMMDKDTFLRLLEAKNSGVDLSIVDDYDNDLFDSIAKLHNIEL